MKGFKDYLDEGKKQEIDKIKKEMEELRKGGKLSAAGQKKMDRLRNSLIRLGDMSAV